MSRQETREAEQDKYQEAYTSPRYKLGEVRKKDMFADVSKILNENNISTHLDISCGRGELIDYVKSHNVASKGVEIVDALLEKEEVQFGWAHDLPFGDKVFDLVSNCDAMEHYLPEDTDAILDEIFRVTNKVAYFTISNEPSYMTSKNGSQVNLHINIKTYDEWEKLLSKYGTCTRVSTNSVSVGFGVEVQ